MTHPTCAGLVTLAAAVVVAAGAARADTFELLAYTPPPGWTAQQTSDARTYVRKDAGAAIIMIFAARPASAAPASLFAEEWAARVAPSFPGAAPRPAVQALGDAQVAVAVTQGSYQQQPVAITFATVVARGRAQSVAAIVSGGEAQGQVARFLETLQLAGESAPAPAGGGEIELEVAAPPGYTLRRDARGVTIAPLTLDRATPCTYGVTPPRASSGNLETDAQAAFADVFAGWQKLRAEEHNHHKRGTSAAGWAFHWYRAELARPSAAGRDLTIGMVMVLPATNGRVSVLWGSGDLATCRMDDLVFGRIFHSLRPRGWTSDGGKAFARELAGSWINSQGGRGAMVYVFHPDGRYQFGLQAVTSYDLGTVALDTHHKLYQEGRWSLAGGELTLARAGRTEPTRERVRMADEYEAGTWVRALYFLDGEREVQYLRQGWRAPSR